MAGNAEGCVMAWWKWLVGAYLALIVGVPWSLYLWYANRDRIRRFRMRHLHRRGRSGWSACRCCGQPVIVVIYRDQMVWWDVLRSIDEPGPAKRHRCGTVRKWK